MKTLELKIANSRGKKPVINAIKKCKSQLDDLLIEINQCEGKTELDNAISILRRILNDNSTKNTFTNLKNKQNEKITSAKIR